MNLTPMGDPKTLRLVQFNVENLFLFLDLYKGQDLKKITEAEWQKLSSSTTQNKPLKKAWALAAVIQEMDPDILMLNEIGGIESLENFNKHFLSSKYKAMLKEGNSNRGIDVGYLVRADLPFQELLLTHRDRPLNFLYPHETQTASGGKSHYFSRDVSELRLFRQNESTPCLVILLTHLKSKLDAAGVDPEGKLRRGAELKTLVALYKDVRRELGTSVPVVVSGDFNGTAGPRNTEPEFTLLHQETDLTETLELIDRPLNERCTQVQITPSGKQNLVQIDFGFVSNELKCSVSAEKTRVYYYKTELGHTAPLPRNIEERGALPSDHYPVIVEITLQ
jgi:endonuclease/exonuclease/phosphatase family metal-dependent hydrolase